ncbi:MAG: Aldehyde Dehydrogenase [Bacteroidetes bacterium]|jgi:glyceraldehyde-3-phosphate dehydrogenase (NADP+)|nr:Aldehyde Dehydrogenase [Bacteroidota bacterium]MDF2452614.1 Aldehyde Dehydrogenase [Bacteroidota bacterium]
MRSNDYKIYSAGHFISTSKILEVKNPFDGSIVAITYLADAPILNGAIEKALSLKEELKDLSSLKKYSILKQISETITANRDHLANVLCLESGKPLKYASAEIDRSAQTFLIAAEESKRIPKEYLSLDWTSTGEKKEGIVNYFPIGLVAGIAPFNFPMNLAVHKIAPAIASGCPIILKPSSTTPLSCLELAKIIDQTELPKGAVSILPMTRETGNLLVTDERFNLLSFTGSPDVGWKMKRECGKKKVVLELGGNAATIVSSSADLKDALPKCLMGAFTYSGQICIHAQRFIVHNSVYQKFTEELKTSALQLKKGDPLNTSTDVSNMIDEANAKRIEEWVNEAIQQGAHLLCGGKRTGSYYEPTILANCNHTMKVYAEEVFGPVICINSFETIEEAIEQANDTRFGLQSGVFTNDISELDICFKHLEVGGVIHNHVPTLRFDHMPYGGIKDSGLGREGVKYAMLDMLEPKVLVK